VYNHGRSYGPRDIPYNLRNDAEKYVTEALRVVRAANEANYRRQRMSDDDIALTETTMHHLEQFLTRLRNRSYYRNQ